MNKPFFVVFVTSSELLIETIIVIYVWLCKTYALILLMLPLEFLWRQILFECELCNAV